MMEFDIVIVGGGMVGAAMALALRDSPYKIALIDATPLETKEDHRLIALTYNSYCLFKNLNIWESLAPFAEPIHKVHVSHRGHFGTTVLNANDLNLATLGYVVPAKYINEALYNQLNHVEILRPAKVISLFQEAEKVSMTVETSEDEKELAATIVIGADGTLSTIRDLLNIPTKIIDYQQSALVTVTDLQRSHSNVAYERFQQEGAIAMLPLVGNRAATIWTNNNEMITHLMQLSDMDFLETLQKQFGYRLGRFHAVSERFRYPLKLVQANESIQDRVILIGNAAHTLHPIAAQGLNLALSEIAEIAEHFKLCSISPGQFSELALRIKRFSKKSTQLSHHLSWIFSKDFFILNQARKFGMLGLDICKPLKKHFTRQAIGHV